MMKPQRAQPECVKSTEDTGASQQAAAAASSTSSADLSNKKGLLEIEANPDHDDDNSDTKYPSDIIEKPIINNTGTASAAQGSSPSSKAETPNNCDSDEEAKPKRKPPQHLLVEEKRPGRPLSAYNLFFQEQRKRILESTPVRAEGKPRRSHGKMGFANMAKTIAGAWNTASPAQKLPFEKLAREEKARYRKKVAAWKKREQQREEALKEYGITPSTNAKALELARPKTSHIPFSTTPSLSQQNDGASTLLSAAAGATGLCKNQSEAKAPSPKPQQQGSSSEDPSTNQRQQNFPSLLSAPSAAASYSGRKQAPASSLLLAATQASSSENKAAVNPSQQDPSLLLAASQVAGRSKQNQAPAQNVSSLLLAAAQGASNEKAFENLPQQDSSLLWAASQALSEPKQPPVDSTKKDHSSLLLAASNAASNEKPAPTWPNNADSSSAMLASNQTSPGSSEPRLKTAVPNISSLLAACQAATSDGSAEDASSLPKVNNSGTGAFQDSSLLTAAHRAATDGMDSSRHSEVWQQQETQHGDASSLLLSASQIATGGGSTGMWQQQQQDSSSRLLAAPQAATGWSGLSQESGGQVQGDAILPFVYQPGNTEGFSSLRQHKEFAAEPMAMDWSGQEQTSGANQPNRDSLRFDSGNTATVQAIPAQSHQNVPQDLSSLWFAVHRLPPPQPAPVSDQANAPQEPDSSSLLFSADQASSSWSWQAEDLEPTRIIMEDETMREGPLLPVAANHAPWFAPEEYGESGDNALALMSEPVLPLRQTEVDPLHRGIGRLSTFMDEKCVAEFVDMFRQRGNNQGA